WGDQTFFGENPPGAAIISWLNKKPVGEVKLVIKDAAGREVRAISGTPLANSNKQGIQMACWDLRVQPNPAPPPAEGRAGRGGAGRAGGAGPGGGGGAGGAGQAGREGGTGPDPPATSPFGAGCPVAQTGGGGGFGGGPNLNGP